MAVAALPPSLEDSRFSLLPSSDIFYVANIYIDNDVISLITIKKIKDWVLKNTTTNKLQKKEMVILLAHSQLCLIGAMVLR